MATDLGTPDRTLAGLDALELAGRAGGRSRAVRVWAATWPKLLALAIVIGLWQVGYLSGWWDPWVLPSPVEVGAELRQIVPRSQFWTGLAT